MVAGRTMANREQEDMRLDAEVEGEVAAAAVVVDDDAVDGLYSRVGGVEDAAAVEVPAARGGDDAV